MILYDHSLALTAFVFDEWDLVDEVEDWYIYRRKASAYWMKSRAKVAAQEDVDVVGHIGHYQALAQVLDLYLSAGKSPDPRVLEDVEAWHAELARKAEAERRAYEDIGRQVVSRIHRAAAKVEVHAEPAAAEEPKAVKGTRQPKRKGKK
jgi:hypothetical protein